MVNELVAPPDLVHVFLGWPHQLHINYIQDKKELLSYAIPETFQGAELCSNFLRTSLFELHGRMDQKGHLQSPQFRGGNYF